MSNHNTATYRASLSTGLWYIVFFMILFGFIILWFTQPFSFSWFAGTTFLLLYLFYNLLIPRISEVTVDTSALAVQYRNYFRSLRTDSYALSQVEFTYKRQATSLRSGVKNICTIFFAGKKVFRLIPNDDGWRDEEISTLVYTLMDRGVKNRFLGYSLKDVQM